MITTRRVFERTTASRRRRATVGIHLLTRRGVKRLGRFTVGWCLGWRRLLLLLLLFFLPTACEGMTDHVTDGRSDGDTTGSRRHLSHQTWGFGWGGSGRRRRGRRWRRWGGARRRRTRGRRGRTRSTAAPTTTATASTARHDL